MARHSSDLDFSRADGRRDPGRTVSEIVQENLHLPLPRSTARMAEAATPR